MKIGIGIAATGKYCYALKAQAQRLMSCFLTCPEHEYVIIFVGNTKSQTHYQEYKDYFQSFKNVSFVWCSEQLEDGHVNYTDKAQAVIAKLQGRYFNEARKLNVDYLWSLESDVLPPANAIRVLIDGLNFDGNYYDVSFLPYPSQGGGVFLAGFGVPTRPIFPDVYPEERVVPKELQIKWDKSTKENIEFNIKGKKMEKVKDKTTEEFKLLQTEHLNTIEEWKKTRIELEEEINKSPAKGNVWYLQSLGYKRRGWLDVAIPGLGKGALIQVDWCGTGATMLSKRALNVSNFDGYEGKGTQDLYLIYNKWYPHNIRICAIPHALCDHVIREILPDGTQGIEKLTLATAYHETEGECKGHVRIKKTPFIQ